MAVHVLEPPVVDSIGRLEELALIIRDEHSQVERHARVTLEHALRCGDALLEAHELVPHGEWNPWLDANCVAYGVVRTTARTYMRLARNRHLLAEHDQETVYGAARILRSLPEVVGGKGMYARRRQFSGDPDEACRMYADGSTYQEIADHFGVSITTIYYYINPAKREASKATQSRKREQIKRAQSRIEQDALDAAARRMSGGVSEIYSTLRKLTQSVDVVWRETAATPAIRAACGEMLQHLHAAEDACNAALKAAPVVSRKRGPRPKKELVS